MVHHELNETLVKICPEKWCTILHYFAFLYVNCGRIKLNGRLLLVHSSFKIHHTATYILKLKLELW